MKVVRTPIDGLLVLEGSPSTDDRGSFLRTFDRQAFAAAGLVVDFPEHSLSTSDRRGTIRGLHLQRPPHGETKVVRCVRGRVWDVVADARPDSATRGRWHAVELDASGASAVYIAEGLLHGFQTLEDDSALLYLISTPYVAEAATGVRWDDPTFSIAWPGPPTAMSERDRRLPFVDA